MPACRVLVTTFCLLSANVSAQSPASCGAIVAGETSAIDFYDHEIARYGTDLTTATATIRARLKAWESACDDAAQRTAVQELRKLIGRTQDRAQRTYLQALLATALSRGPEVRVPDSHGGLFMSARRNSLAEREARRLFSDVIEAWPAETIVREYATLALATRDRETLKSADDALERVTRESPHPELQATHALIAALRRDTVRAASIARAIDTAAPRVARRRSIALLLSGADMPPSQHVEVTTAAATAARMTELLIVER